MQKILDLIVLARSLEDTDPLKERIEEELMRLQGFSPYNVVVPDYDVVHYRTDNSFAEIGFNEGGPTVELGWALDRTMS